MSGRKVLLDTSAVISIFKGTGSAKELIGSGPTLYLPSIALGELFYGAFNSSNREKHLAQLDDLLEVVEVISVDEEVSKVYGKVKSQLKRAGTPIPENDVWIAAVAMASDLLLATNDAHFQNVKGIETVSV